MTEAIDQIVATHSEQIRDLDRRIRRLANVEPVEAAPVQIIAITYVTGSSSIAPGSGNVDLNVPNNDYVRADPSDAAVMQLATSGLYVFLSSVRLTGDDFAGNYRTARLAFDGGPSDARMTTPPLGGVVGADTEYAWPDAFVSTGQLTAVTLQIDHDAGGNLDVEAVIRVLFLTDAPRAFGV